MYHGVETRETVGIYRTFWAHQMYLPAAVVFTTGLAHAGDHYIVASGEADLACRMTHIPKAMFT
jgi:beta-1,2-mannobiose phosphorylase / 1,2-beta-oligomannan phosphorylase